MNNFSAFIPKKTLVLILFLVGAILILAFILFINQAPDNPSSPNPVISKSPSKVSPLQKSIIGQTTMAEIDETNPDKKEATLSNGDLGYLFNSQMESRPHEVVFHNSVSAFERIVLLGNTAPDVPNISSLISKFGQPEKTIKGSQFYGRHMQTYIYPAKGLAFIGNPNTDEVFEIQVFTPASLENYLSSYGEDIKEYKEIRE